MQREAYFDNAKLLFIFLVVFGHLIQPLKPNIELVDALYQSIYFFHMPVFILVSGFFAKGSSDKGYIKKLFQKLLIPYFIFQLTYSIYFLGIGKSEWDSSIYDPHWGLWFLLSLFTWHMMLIVFKKIPPVFGIPFAFLLGILIGYVPLFGGTLSLSRTFVFFPFFLIGYWLTKEALFKWRKKVLQLVSASILASVLVISYFTPTIPASWLFGSSSYQALDEPVYGGLIRLAIYIVAICMVFAILLLVPKKEYSYTHLGQYTMYVYLLHGVVIQFARQNNLLQLDHNLDTIGLAVIVAALVRFLSSRWVITFTQPLVEGRTTLLQNWWEERQKKQVYHYE
ncbi:acyltransferase family protein [Gracilibacillus sp. YIM 98692]|uniref:acyltransferase family protein n=1 Tax=Gracilibacillus sp. YIM 98692 TaxID=2663532 RepID=UPI0013D85F77|nr:acyltransferase family protein [Gracilibacillus sp. YIM 98692]